MGLSQNRTRLVGRLRSRKQREREGAVLVEGVRAVSEALAAGATPRFVIVSPRLAATEAGRALADALGTGPADILGTGPADAFGGGPADVRGGSTSQTGPDVEEVSDEELEALSDTEQPQGVLAVVDQPGAPLSELPGAGTVLVLDAVQDPGNVGTLVRSAVAFGLAGVVCLDGTADPWGAKTVRASAGMVFRLPVWTDGFDDVATALAGRGADVIAADADGRPAPEVLSGEDASGSNAAGTALRALVLGNEGAGVRPEVRALARATVAVPMRGPAESLNVAVAGSILMYECMRALENR